jgi:hypothetical protein
VLELGSIKMQYSKHALETEPSFTTTNLNYVIVPSGLRLYYDLTFSS